MEKELIILVVFIASIIIKEIKDTNGRSKIHKRINSLDETYVRRDICYERTDRLLEDITEIKKDVKEILKNGKK